MCILGGETDEVLSATSAIHQEKNPHVQVTEVGVHRLSTGESGFEVLENLIQCYLKGWIHSHDPSDYLFRLFRAPDRATKLATICNPLYELEGVLYDH